MKTYAVQSAGLMTVQRTIVRAASLLGHNQWNNEGSNECRKDCFFLSFFLFFLSLLEWSRKETKKDSLYNVHTGMSEPGEQGVHSA